MKRILGLDLGTNSIGWALIETEKIEEKEEFRKIINANSRIIPMDQSTIGDFNTGNLKSQTAERTRLRGVRRLYERKSIRRERLNRVLSVMGCLPEHYRQCLDEYGKFLPETEPKLAWKINENGKYEFIFQTAYNEMLEDFKARNPEALNGGKRIPYDWTIYYLRKKALYKALSDYELSWILLHFNQKRGYYQLRDESDSQSGKKEEYLVLKVVDVVDTGEKNKKNKAWFNIVLENELVYRCVFDEAPDWIGKTKEFIITTYIDDSGNQKKDENGEIKYSLRLPAEGDWTLIKKKTEADIDNSGNTVGEYIYETIIKSPETKIKGKLVQTVERAYYRTELETILDTQMRLNPILQDKELYGKCIETLYRSNVQYRDSIAKRDFKYLLINDIIFYQRPLKTKKGLIDNCPFESYTYMDKATGLKIESHLKCVAKSNPYFQEFRLWQFLLNLKILDADTGVDLTKSFIPDNTAKADLFTWMNGESYVNQEKFFKYKGLGIKSEDRVKYRWNYVEDKKYPGNETRGEILSALKKAGVSPDSFYRVQSVGDDLGNPADKEQLSIISSRELDYALWHLLYSIDDRLELKKALAKFAAKNADRIPDAGKFVDAFMKIKPFEKKYGSYSEKAVKKLLPLMRLGKYWSENAFDEKTRERISKIINAEYDETISDRVREKTMSLQSVEDFQGLPVWIASYIVYNIHSEAREVVKWNSPEDIDNYLRKFRQYSLRNPIVESVVLETLRVVRDVWREYGKIDEIHIELGREMKNSAEKRKQITARALENENTNLRIKAMLSEFKLEGTRPNSPSQQEILRIYEEAVLTGTKVPDDVQRTIAKFNQKEAAKRPTKSEMEKYKCWLGQKYRSPYTGRIIPLAKLFTHEYQIEHIIPQSKYFDDSLNNKVICEAAVNKDKADKLAHVYISEAKEKTVDLGEGRKVKVLSLEEYEKFVTDNYKGSRNALKRMHLLADDIPEGFVKRQLNDTRYISKFVKALLSNVVREDGEEQDTSKNIITCSGAVTDRLKKDWGINDAWKELMMPRFERMDAINEDEQYVAEKANGHKVPCVPDSRRRGFEMKRIDHRHHAMDAIVIACATRNIVSYLNNESACSGAKFTRQDLRRLVCDGNGYKDIKKPSPDFVEKVKSTLNGCIVSFKQNVRVINKTSNHYEKIIDGKKVSVKQRNGDGWSIRKSMHKDTVWGSVNLRLIKSVPVGDALKNPARIVRKDVKDFIKECGTNDNKGIKLLLLSRFPDLKKLDVYYYTEETNEPYFATRTVLSTDFNKDFIENHITDSGIAKILLRHLENCDWKSDVAFSQDGIDRMNANIVELNGGRPHKPIYRVRKFEKSNKFQIGETGNKAKKFVESDKGTKLFFGVYLSPSGKRTYCSIPLIEAINREKDGLSPVPEMMGEDRLLFYLSPNDLVYVPTSDEIENGYVNEDIDMSRVYKMVSCEKKQCFFIQHTVSKPIVEGVEFNKHNKIETLPEGTIKSICVPLKVDRLGKIVSKEHKIR